MHSSRTFEFRVCFVVDALPFLFFLCGCVSLFVSFVGDVDGYEEAVEQADDLVVRERTAPEIGGAPSAAADVHLADIAEEKNWPAIRPGKHLGGVNARPPANSIETTFHSGR